MKISISGSTGFVGENLSKHLSSLGHTIIPIKREDFELSSKDLSKKINGSDIVINLAGEKIFQRWTKAAKKRIYNSRITTTKKIVDSINISENKPSLFISTSAVGIYPNQTVITDNISQYADNFLAKVCKDWEQEAFKTNPNTRTLIFRFGVILGHGGMLNQIKKIYNNFLGGQIGNGKQGFSWIHINDLLNSYSYIIDNYESSNENIYNLTSPKPVSNKDFNKILGKILNRPSVLIIPVLAIKLVYKNAVKLISEGAYVYPKQLEKIGYPFAHSNIEESLKEILKK